MKRFDRAGTAALSLTGVVVATAVGVGFTAAAKSPRPAQPGIDGNRTINLVSPRASSSPTDEILLGPTVPGLAVEGAASAVTTTVPATGAPATTTAPGSRGTSSPGDARGDGTPEDNGNGTTIPSDGDGPGDRRGDGTPEDDTDDDHHRRGRSGADDSDEKDNSGPGNYENPGRSNSGGDD